LFLDFGAYILHQPYGDAAVGKKLAKLDGILINEAWMASVINYHARWGIAQKRFPRTIVGIWKDHAILQLLVLHEKTCKNTDFYFTKKIIILGFYYML
jgi:hypothetical protein